jgi:hypothetical protein
MKRRKTASGDGRRYRRQLRGGECAVRVYPGTDGEVGGTVVEDFGDLAGHVVDIGENHIVGAARRWAVALDAGGLVFVDSDQLAAE